jgi:hypothetical protein
MSYTQDLLGEGGGNQAYSYAKSTARELIRYEPRAIQPTKLAEKLAREYKKWHTVPPSPPPACTMIIYRSICGVSIKPLFVNMLAQL